MEIITVKELDDYIPNVGEPFKIIIDDGYSDLIIHPYFHEDSTGIYPDIIGGFDVYNEDGNFLNDCQVKEDILKCI